MDLNVYIWFVGRDADHGQIWVADTTASCSGRWDTLYITLKPAAVCDTTPPTPDSLRVAHPTAFTPNGDGKNDTFYPLCSKPCKVELLRIYNSWGEIVHEGDTAWDGTYRGTAQPTGAYWYHSRIDGLPFHGVVTMLR